MGIKRINSLENQSHANEPVFATFASTGPAAGGLNTVAIQLQDKNRNDLSVRGAVPFWLSTEANGDLALTTALTCSLSQGTDGLVHEWVAQSSGLLVSETDGDIDMTMGDSLARSVFIHLAMPNGSIVSSSSQSVSS